MVKNKTGGNRHKKMASKNAKPSYKRKTRFSQCDDEIYRVITQNCGGGHAIVLCDDNVQRLLVIRRKFSGRNKRDNKIDVNSIVLCGKRAWEVRCDKKKEKVDLLYVYSSNQNEELKSLFKKIDVYDILFQHLKKDNKNDNDDIIFTNDIDDETTNIIIKNVENNTNSNKSTIVEEQNKFDFDFDDI
mgnify:CR=1 FL=1